MRVSPIECGSAEVYRIHAFYLDNVRSLYCYYSKKQNEFHLSEKFIHFNPDGTVDKNYKLPLEDFEKGAQQNTAPM